MYAAVYKNDKRGTLNLCFGVALYTTLKALTIFKSLKKKELDELKLIIKI